MLSPGEQVSPGFFPWRMRSSEYRRKGVLESKGRIFKEITLAGLRRVRVRVPVPPKGIGAIRPLIRTSAG